MTTTRLPKTITAGALLATPIPPVKWIIPGLLPAGLAIFAGPSKAGKSWLTLWLCLQISQGKSVWGRENRTENRAVFLAGRYTGSSARAPLPACRCRRRPGTAHSASILTPILASSSSIPCKRCEKPSKMVVCMPMITVILGH